jgi:membrane-bound lytic murein transglycosylase B
MNISRRTVAAWLLASSAAACSGSTAPPVARSAARPVPNAGYDAWLAAFRQRALSQGLSAATIDRGLREAGYIPDVVEGPQPDRVHPDA